MEAAFLVLQRVQATIANRLMRRFQSGSQQPTQAPQPEPGSAAQHAVQSQYVDSGTQTREGPGPENANQILEPEPEQIEEDAVQFNPFVTIVSEDAEDYTDGPAWLVTAFDEARVECPAVLITYDLSKKIQAAIQGQREFAQAEQVINENSGGFVRLEWKIVSELNSHEYHMEHNKEQEDVEALQKEIDTLKLFHAKVKGVQESLQSQLDSMAGELRRQQAEVLAVLEETFVVAKLVAPQEPLPELECAGLEDELDLQEEYAAFVKQLQEENGEAVVSVRDVQTRSEDRQFSADELIPEEQAVQDLKNRYWEAREELGDARNAFGSRETARERAREQRPEVAEEDFDVEWVRTYRNFTRCLIDAEAEFAAAKAAAQEGGLNLEPTLQSSNFLDRASDGYRTSFEAEISESISPEKILAWRTSIPDQASPDFQETDIDIDDWEGDELELGVSVSTIAEPPSREKIDKWRRFCYGSCSQEGRSSTCVGSKVS